MIESLDDIKPNNSNASKTLYSYSSMLCWYLSMRIKEYAV